MMVKEHTLVITESIRLCPIEHPEDLEDIALPSIGTKRVAGAVEAEDEFSFIIIVHSQNIK